MLKAV